jgi:hypothetical protein
VTSTGYTETLFLLALITAKRFSRRLYEENFIYTLIWFFHADLVLCGLTTATMRVVLQPVYIVAQKSTILIRCIPIVRFIRDIMEAPTVFSKIEIA